MPRHPRCEMQSLQPVLVLPLGLLLTPHAQNPTPGDVQVHPAQMLEPPQQAPLDGEEQRFYCELKLWF